MNSAVLILTFGRPDRVYTYNTLRRQGYTGKIFLVCSDDDKTLPDYKKIFGEENVVVFNKRDVQKKFDVADNFSDDRVVVFARNACFDIAQKLKLSHFIEMDDDYLSFDYRYEDSGKLKAKQLNMDKVFAMYFDFLKISRATCVAFAQAGDLIGGCSGTSFKRKILRKIMNVFFCDVKKPFNFLGRFNEDVITYSHMGRQGVLFLTPTQIAMVQKETQSNPGGMADIYKKKGTYFKTFYAVMFEPSCVKISNMGVTHSRIHHEVISNFTYPKILNERLKK